MRPFWLYGRKEDERKKAFSLREIKKICSKVMQIFDWFIFLQTGFLDHRSMMAVLKITALILLIAQWVCELASVL